MVLPIFLATPLLSGECAVRNLTDNHSFLIIPEDIVFNSLKKTTCEYSGVDRDHLRVQGVLLRTGQRGLLVVVCVGI